MKNRNLSLTLAFLLTAGASFVCSPLHATKYTDPFGKVNDSQYQYTMNITGYVRYIKLAEGEWVPANEKLEGVNTVVAAYCGDELRGKGYTADYNGKYFSLLMMTIYGNNKDKLYFKVFIPDNPADLKRDDEEDEETDPEVSEPLPVAPGRIIEYAPEGLTFKSDTRLGKATDPYYVEVPQPIATTFSSDGWASTCLPYDALIPDGVTPWNATAIEDSELVMESKDGALVLPKNTPVVLQLSDPDSQSSTPTQVEWLSKVVTESAEASSLFTVESSILEGTTEPVEVEAKSVLTLGHSNEADNAIGFWLYTGTTIAANRAYIADIPDGSRGARIVTGDMTTGIYDMRLADSQSDRTANRDCYDLQGRKVGSAGVSPTPASSLKKGIYVIDGKKIVIR